MNRYQRAENNRALLMAHIAVAPGETTGQYAGRIKASQSQTHGLLRRLRDEGRVDCRRERTPMGGTTLRWWLADSPDIPPEQVPHRRRDVPRATDWDAASWQPRTPAPGLKKGRCRYMEQVRGAGLICHGGELWPACPDYGRCWT